MQFYFGCKDNVPKFVGMVNYFELYGLPVSFSPDQSLVKKKYYELSRQFHPDRFTQGGAAAMDEALKMSAQVNEGYKLLTDQDTTMGYVLRYLGALDDEEKYNLPPNFLMDMMDLNEAVSEAEMDPTEDNLELAIGNLKQQMEELEAELKELTEKYTEGADHHSLLLEIKDAWFRKKYLLRIKERIAKFATP